VVFSVPEARDDWIRKVGVGNVRFFSFFIILALVIMVALQYMLYADLQLPFYLAWLINVNLTTFLFYWLDKVLARIKKFTIRVPELLLNLMALAGGFLGGWLGRSIFHHKTNIRKHWGILVILIVSTLLHGALIYLVFFRSLEWGGG
jgi:uncharacterized membrane protein YsdA (DUF1294 family)